MFPARWHTSFGNYTEDMNYVLKNIVCKTLKWINFVKMLNFNIQVWTNFNDQIFFLYIFYAFLRLLGVNECMKTQDVIFKMFF